MNPSSILVLNRQSSRVLRIWCRAEVYSRRSNSDLLAGGRAAEAGVQLRHVGKRVLCIVAEQPRDDYCHQKNDKIERLRTDSWLLKHVIKHSLGTGCKWQGLLYEPCPQAAIHPLTGQVEVKLQGAQVKVCCISSESHIKVEVAALRRGKVSVERFGQ